MDKIKEEFRDWFYYSIPEQMYNEVGLLLAYRQACKPRDEEIEKLKQTCKNYQKACNNYKDKIIRKDKEIKKLKVQTKCWRTQYMKLYEMN